MSFLDPNLDAVVARLGWTTRPNAENSAELIIGDYARGFLIMKLEQEIQVAQRSLRGEPSLKLRTNDLVAAQQYVGFYAARLLRFREGKPDVAVSVDPAEIVTPFELRSSQFECGLAWGQSWVEFGVGNEFAAAQFAQCARDGVAGTVLTVLQD